MSKFKANDRIAAIENGFQATVLAVSFNSIHQEDEYYIMWDNFLYKGVCCYNASEADDLWKKIGQVSHEVSRGYVNQDPDFLPPGHNVVTSVNGYGPGMTKKPEQCEHKWVEVGFQHTKTVCYHCDMEKP